MWRIKALLSVVIAVFTGSASASGPYDGIYSLPGTQLYWSIHQNNGGIIVAAFNTIPASNIFLYLSNGQYFDIPRLDVWDLFSGPLSGTHVTLTGEMAYGACLATYSATFSASAVTVTGISFVNTPFGNSRGVNCPGLFQYTSGWITQTLPKVF